MFEEPRFVPGSRRALETAAARRDLTDARPETERVLDAIVDFLLEELGVDEEEESAPVTAPSEIVRVCWRRDCPMPL